ncbi:Protein of unknown function [Thermobacillus xylanilyticus]|uniref:Transposase n=1 Tax=Thermobacillus xylanilyticus TaxID=76633 RepID=A0ABM8V2X8_THEXY|nr:Protein of unknown function [Thermobacillus xylanilyticus]
MKLASKRNYAKGSYSKTIERPGLSLCCQTEEIDFQTDKNLHYSNRRDQGKVFILVL